METFAVYTDWRLNTPIGDHVVGRVSQAFRPDDESVCIWVDEHDPAVLKVSADVQATDYEEAGRTGRRPAHEAAALVDLPGRLVKVAACTEQGQAVWSDPDQELSA